MQQPLLGKNPDTDPGVDCTVLGLVLYGRLILANDQLEKHFFLTSSADEFNRLCSQDVLDLTDKDDFGSTFHEHSEKIVYTSEGHYKVYLPWKIKYEHLPTNKELVKARLSGTTRRLEKQQ